MLAEVMFEIFKSNLPSSWKLSSRKITFPPILALGALLTTILPTAFAQSVESSEISSLHISQDGEYIVLNWTPPADSSVSAYTLQTTPRLNDNIWVNALAELPLPETQISWSETNSLNQRFYRLLQVEHAEQGRLEEIISKTPYNKMIIKLMAQSFLGDIDLPIEYDVTLYTVKYETLTPSGSKTLASGIYAIPENCTVPNAFLSYQHGTIMEKKEAPSQEDTLSQIGCVLAASMGYITTASDYLGLGSGESFHPYCHRGSEATAALDLLRTARNWCIENDQPLPVGNPLYMLGYSQGGHATMSLHREIELWHSDEFQVIASAPMAGPYDLSGTMMSDFLSEREMPAPYYYAYLIAGYQQAYQFGNSMADLLAPPYDTQLPPLLDGYHSSAEINALMPSHPREILKPEILQAIMEAPEHPIRIALADNDTSVDWTPKGLMRLYHSQSDTYVPWQNSLTAQRNFRLKGCQVELIDPAPGLDHGDAALPAIQSALLWFISLEEARQNGLL